MIHLLLLEIAAGIAAWLILSTILILIFRDIERRDRVLRQASPKGRR
jgi:hypothetical protein